MNVLVIGSSAWDTIMNVGDVETFSEDMFLWANSYHNAVGSTGAGKALCLDSLGVKTTLVTSLGDDDFKEKILDYINKTNLDVVNLPVDKSIAHTNLMYNKGSRISVVTSFPTIEPEYNKDIEKLILESDIVFLNINNFAREYINVIKKHNKLCFVDIHDYDPPNPYHTQFIEAADILVCSGIYIDDKRKFLEEQIQTGKKLVVITLGSKGLIALTENNEYYELPGYDGIDFVDSNGAGDSFCAGLGFALASNKSILESLQFGTICGGLSCTSTELFPKNHSMKHVETLRQKYFKIK